MIITVLAQKYKCDCGKGMNAASYLGLVDILNSLIEWDKCEWPKRTEGEGDDKKEVEIKDFLGNPPELKPGNCILWEGNVISFSDPDTAVLIVSETGPLSVNRFIQEVKNEEELGRFRKINIEEIQKDKPDNVECFRLGYDMWKVIKPRYNRDREVCLSVIDDEIMLFPVSLWVDKQSIWFDPEEIEKEIISEISISIYQYLIKGEK